jgi:hypothetical protein
VISMAYEDDISAASVATASIVTHRFCARLPAGTLSCTIGVTLMNIELVRNAIEALKQRDSAFELFGAPWHRYQLNPRLSELEVMKFENRHGIRLPEAYRDFVLNVGDGGAGPYYGVFRLGKMDDLGGEESEWKEGEFVGYLRDCWPHRQAWNLPKEALTVPDGLSDDAIDSAIGEIDKRYWDAALVAGAFPICHHGCALRDWLVITGPEAGQVWHDARVDQKGLRPYESADGKRLTFTQWYLNG